MKNLRTIFIAVVAVITCSTSALAFEGQNIDLLSLALERWDDAMDVELSGDYAYVAAGRSGVKVVDISDLEHPRQVGTFADTFDFVYKIELYGELLFFSHFDGSSWYREDSTRNFISWFTLENALQPQWGGTVELHRGRSLSFTVRGQQIFTAVDYYSNEQMHGCVEVIDLANMEEPTVSEIWSADQYIQGMALVDESLCVALDQQLTILDVTDLRNVEVLSETSDVTGALVSDEEIVYLISSSEVICLDVSDPNSPQVIGRIDNWCCTFIDVVLADNMLWILSVDPEGFTGGSNGRDNGNHPYLSQYDVSDPTAPTFIGVTDFNSRWFVINGISIRGELCFLSYRQSLVIADVSSIEEPQIIGSLSTDGISSRVAVSDDVLYVVDDHKLRAVDVSNLRQPTPIATFHVGVTNLAIREDLAYTIGDSFRIFDISDPTEFIELSAINPSRHELHADELLEIKVSGDRAYLSTSSALIVIDISNPERPRSLIELSLDPYWTYYGSFELYGDFAYVINGDNSLTVVDFTDLQNPRIYPVNLHQRVVDISISGSRAYFIGGGYLTEYDISDPTHPDSIGRYECIDGGMVKIQGDFAYVAPIYDNNAQLTVINISDPNNWREVGSAIIESFGRIEDIEIDNNLIYIAYRENVAILNNNLLGVGEDRAETAPMKFELLEAFPNPFNSTTTVSFDLPQASSLSLRIYDLSGRPVTTLVDGFLKTGQYKALWDAYGVASGSYLARMEAANYRGTIPITLVK